MMRRLLLSGLVLAVLVELCAVALPHVHGHEISCSASQHGSSPRQDSVAPLQGKRDVEPCLACSLTTPSLALAPPEPVPDAPAASARCTARRGVNRILELCAHSPSRDPPSPSV